MTEHSRQIFVQPGNTNTTTIQKVLWIVVLLAVIMQACTGYIINENGQLVPFRLYKKGNHGSRVMCFLHPRNCRGGFHKRLSDEPVPHGLPRDLYELKVYKRKQQADENHGNYDRKYNMYDNVIFSPDYNAQSREGLPHVSEHSDHNSYGTARLRLGEHIYGVYPSRKSDYVNTGINDIEISETDLETLKDMKEANLLLDDLSKGIGQVAEPPALDMKPRIKAEVEEYPSYELLQNYDTLYTENGDRHTNDDSVYSPVKTVDIYGFRRRM